MRKLLRLIPICASVPLFVTICACSVPGIIGEVEMFIEETINLQDYIENDDGSGYFEKSCEHNSNELDVLLGSDMEFCSYSLIGLKLKGSQNSVAEITTLTFELEFEEDCDFNLAIYIDADIQYESGVRSYSAKKTYSLVVSGISYPTSASNLFFRNEPDSEKPEEPYSGYATRWKLKYLQIVYQER